MYRIGTYVYVPSLHTYFIAVSYIRIINRRRYKIIKYIYAPLRLPVAVLHTEILRTKSILMYICSW